MIKITQKLHFRLTILYSCIFLSAFIIFSLLSLFFFYRSFEHEDNMFASWKLRSYWAHYQNMGVESLFMELYSDNNISGDRPYMIRAADGANNTLLLNYPQAWKHYNIQHLDQFRLEDFKRKIELQTRHSDESIEITSVYFNDDLLIQIGISNGRRIAILRNYQKNMMFFFFTLAVLCILGGSLLAFRALKPLKTLNRTLQGIIKTGDLSARVAVRQNGDDLDEIGALFNTMTGRIETLISRMKETVNAVAHDLKTPLTRLRGTAELALLSDAPDSVRREALSDVMEASEDILKMLDSIMDINEAESGILKLHKKETDLSAIALELGEMYQFIAEDKNISIKQKHPPGGVQTICDEVRIRQATGNLLDNAVKFAPQNSQIRISSFYDSENRACLSICDQGPGIPENEKEYIFTRLYRGANTAGIKGAGLGLSLVQAIMEAHQGSVELCSDTPNGACFCLKFKKPGQ